VSLRIGDGDARIRRRHCRIPTIFVLLLFYFHHMPYDPEKHHRRSVRIKGYDYTQPGVYYITICTKERQCIFGEVINGQMRLNFLGDIAHTCWLAIPNHFASFQLDTFVIMPDHVHGLLAIVDNTPVTKQQRPILTREQFGQPVRGSIPTAIRSYKGAVTRLIHKFCETTEVPVWQDGFHESIIRDEEILNCKRQYIINNPQRWGDNPQKLEHQKNHPILLDLRF
jgi:putative transposase